MNLPHASAAWLESWMPPQGYRAASAILCLFLMIIAVHILIVVDGGIMYATVHLMYIPIILASIMFSWPGGLIAGIIAGIVAGPYLPLNVETREMQDLSNWLIRLEFFALIGTFAGFIFSLLHDYTKYIRWLAHHHAKSGLPNRLDLEATLQQKLIHRDPPFYLGIIEVLNYDQLSDLFGYTATDELIQSLREEIAQRFPRISYYAHYHPERLAFTVDVSIVQSIGKGETPLVELLGQSLSFNQVNIHLHSIIGYVESSYQPGATPEKLIQMAEIALYHARSKHLESCMYTDAIPTMGKDTLIYLGALKAAIENAELTLYYQPKQDLRTGKIIGAEALIRWNSPTMGFISPDKFIPQAEQTQLIQPLTRFVIETAIKDFRTLNELGIPVKISINLATKNLSDKALLETIRSLVESQTADPRWIDFEITESGVMDDPKTCIQFMHALKNMGFTLSIDDYGTGHAALSYLKMLPIDTLKIDQSFIKDLLTQHTSQEIVSATITMAKGLGLHTVAEGVETQGVADKLKDLGCDTIQGYLYSKPLPLDAFIEFIHQR